MMHSYSMLLVLLVWLALSHFQGKVDAIAFPSSRLQTVPSLSVISQHRLQLKEKLPVAVASTVKVSFHAAITNGAMMVPLSLFLGLFQKHPSVAAWFASGIRGGLEWSVLSGVYSGTEEFLKVVREKDDIWNRAIASGLASCVAQTKSYTPRTVATNFLTGFGFVFALDYFLAKNNNNDKPVDLIPTGFQTKRSVPEKN